eukprot:TRINITY_DN83663_c0_g1_i1.p1 TRINITY_DN83663_c0_g1~~TRINITY_DN83663_c0_g1_i1.p1  ORF type:complete len:349 (-),score=76.74 TRINITY_DN83663_c0_g1_i1:52-1098(-)
MPVASIAGLIVAGASLLLLVAASLAAQEAFASATRSQLERVAQRRMLRGDGGLGLRSPVAGQRPEDDTATATPSLASSSSGASFSDRFSPSSARSAASSRLQTALRAAATSSIPQQLSTHRQLRYRVLLLDHDDTTVRGTEQVHYPAHVESLRILRPELTPVSLHDWFMKNHEPGISSYLKSLFSDQQMVEEHEIWERAIAQMVPCFYDGMPELLREFKARGGRIAVVSHSPTKAIWKHYEAHPLADSIRPDLVLGWDHDPARRKPAVWPALRALDHLEASPDETLVLDDLSPGVKMAKAAGIHVAGAGWGHDVQPVQEYMRKECNYYFSSVKEFSDFLFGDRQHSAL